MKKGAFVLYDTIIIGMGPAGLQAGLYTSRANLKTLIIGDFKKSQLAKAHVVENYFGLGKTGGLEILENGMEQVKKFGASVLCDEVVHVEKTPDGIFFVKTATAKVFNGKTVLLATGMAYKVGNIKNEDVFSGKGVHHCVTCDGAFYNGKKLAVIGAGNFAAEEAIRLLSYTHNVTLISHAQEFQFFPEMDAALRKAKIRRVTGKVRQFFGDTALRGVFLESGERMAFDGVFMGIGTASAVSFAATLGIAMRGNAVAVDQNGCTNVQNVYAAGSCTGGHAQLAKEVGEGCNAALYIIKTLLKKTVYIDYEKSNC